MVPEGWKQLDLSRVCDKPISYGIVQTGPYVKDGIPCVRVNDLSEREIRVDRMVKTSSEINESYKKTILEQDEIILALRGDVGLARIVDGPLVNINITRGIARISPNQQLVHPNYLLWELRSPTLRADLLRRVGGSALQEISLSELRKVKTLVPPIREQVKIASTLSTWDQAIETTEKLIENSKAQKKALMQQLLTGKKRYSQFIDSQEKRETKYGDLPLDWLFLPIGDIAFEQSERAGKNSKLPVLSCSKHVGFVDSLQYFKKKVYSDDTSNYKVVRRGCYGFPSNHIEEGSIGYQDICDAGIVSPIYSVFKTSKRVHDGYLFRLLKTEHYRQIFQARTNASVDRRGSLRWKEFCEIYVPLPSVAEQQKIAETIDSADNDFANLSDQLVQLQTQKRALMQQLLTGKRRVKVAA